MNKKLKNALSWRGVPLYLIAERNGTPTINFVSERYNTPEELEFWGFDDVDFVMHSKFTWANIISSIGIFPSTGVARKSGWDIPIDEGYTEAFFQRSDGTPLFVFIMK